MSDNDKNFILETILVFVLVMIGVFVDPFFGLGSVAAFSLFRIWKEWRRNNSVMTGYLMIDDDGEMVASFATESDRDKFIKHDMKEGTLVIMSVIRK